MENGYLIFFDFSVNVTSVCVFNTKVKTYKYFLFMNSCELSKVKDFDIKSHSIMKEYVNDVVIHQFYKKPMERPKGQQHDFGNYMIESCKTIKNSFSDFLKEIKDYIGNEKFIIGVEDYPTNIKSNNQIEMAEIISQMKSALYSEFTSKFLFYQPQQIKMVTGNGNHNKEQMLMCYIKKQLTCKIYKIICKNYKSYILSNGKVKKPIEDLVDSFWGVQLMRKELNF